MLRLRPIVLAMSIALAACAQTPHKSNEPAKAGEAAKAVNPFFAQSTLPFQAPPFDKIHDSDYAPAFDEGMKEQLAEVDKIANQADAPNFDNTIVALERTGATLTRVSKVFFALAQANTNDTLQKIQEDYAPKLAAHQDAIFLNAKLYARVKKLYDDRASLGLDAESSRLLDRYHLAFVRAGAELSLTDQAKLKELNKEESSLSTAFQQKLLAATKDGALVIDNKAQLAGFNAGDLAAALEAGKNRKLDGKYVVALQNTTQQPAQESLTDRKTREQLFKASIDRAEHSDANDTRATIQRLAELRVQKANLLGYKTYAD